MKQKIKRRVSVAGAAFLWALLNPPVWAEEIPYDRYAPASAESAAVPAGVSHFLVYPFEIPRRPVDQTLVFVEKHHIDDKLDWIYEQMTSHGFTPRLRSVFGGDSFGGGFDVEFLKLSGLKENFPDLSLEGSTLWTFDGITDYRMKVIQENIAGTTLSAESLLSYEKREEEHFYGIGPDTSLGDGSNYRMERTTLEGALGQQITESWKIREKVSYQHVNITNSKVGGRGVIDEIFVATGRQRVPGLAGDEILSAGVEVVHDHRDPPDLPTRGGYEKAGVTYHKGLESSAGYLKYRAEAAHYFPVFSNRQVLAVRLVGEHNDEVGDRDVPFFNLARLGGHGTYPRFGDAQRGFRRDRFYDESLLLLNLEYRWTVYQYRDWKMDAVLFWDEGQVFGEWSRFQFQDFRGSLGGGLRLGLLDDLVLSVEIGKSSEGTEFYVKTKTPF